MSWEVMTMQLKSWCFNRALFRKNMTRFWPIWVLSTLIWLIAMPLMVVSEVLNGRAEAVQMNADSIVAAWAGGCYIVAVIDAIVCAMAVFSYLFQHRSAVAIHMLPMRRECLFITNYLSGLALMVLPMVICLAVTAVAEGVLGCLNWTVLLMWFTAQLLADLFFYSWAVFCTSLTGNLVMFPLLYVGLQAVPWVLRQMVTSICHTMLHGFYSFPALDDAALWLSPLWNLWRNVKTVWRASSEYTRQYFLHGWKCLLIYLLVSLVLSLLALALYRLRRVETAGDVIAIPVLRPAFRYFFCFFCAIAVAGILSELVLPSDKGIWNWGYVLIYLVLLLLGGFLGYFSAQMMLNKRLDVFRMGWAGYGVCMLVLAVAVCTLKLDVFGFQGWLPEEDQVESVEVRRDEVTLTQESSIHQVVLLHTNLVDHAREEQALVQEYDRKLSKQEYSEEQGDYVIDGMLAGDWCGSHERETLTLIYNMKNGTTRTRTYEVYLDEARLEDSSTAAAQLQELVNLPEYIQGVHQGVLNLDLQQVKAVNLYTYQLVGDNAYREYYIDLGGDSARTVVQALQKDLKTGTGLTNWLLDSMYGETAYSWSYLNISVGNQNLIQTGYDTYYTGEDWYNVVLTPDWTNTIQVLTDLGILDEEHFLATSGDIGDRNWLDTAGGYDLYTNSYTDAE